MADDRSRGVHLTDKQLVFVFMAGTVVAVVVFLCGVLVGRGVQAVRGQAADDTMMTPPQVVADGSADPLAADPPPAEKVGRDAELTYAERLGRTPPPEQLKPIEEPKPLATMPADPAPPPEVPEDVGGAAQTDATGGGWVVQVTVVKKRADADPIVKRLKTRGYEAFVFVPEAGDKLGVFRVRIGPFKTRREADNIARRIEREERYKPWVTR